MPDGVCVTVCFIPSGFGPVRNCTRAVRCMMFYKLIMIMILIMVSAMPMNVTRSTCSSSVNQLYKRGQIVSTKTRTVFIFEDAIVRIYEDYLGLCRWSWFTNYRPAPLSMDNDNDRCLTFLTPISKDKILTWAPFHKGLRLIASFLINIFYGKLHQNRPSNYQRRGCSLKLNRF